MRITRFRIQGFKSIDDVTVDGLSDINVFFGRNDVGKSNIIEALELWHRLLSMSGSVNEIQVAQDFEQRFGTELFQLDGDDQIIINVDMVFEQLVLPVPNWARIDADESVSSASDPDMKGTARSVATHLSSQVEVELRGDDLAIESHANWEDGKTRSITPFHVISANRRFQFEQRDQGKLTGPVDHDNLKKALFYAYLSSDVQQKKRFAAIKTLLAEPPFSLGELDVALDPDNDEINIGFIRPHGRLPLENLGSGSQQLLLVLGQVFLNDFPIIALEEPEMNLSPQRQQELMVALRRLMQDPAISLKQLFISTHSPYFEFTENFYDVTLDESGHTQVTRTTEQDWNSHFAIAPLGPETGARLNSLNQVRLYDGLINDLKLKRGDMVVFVRNDVGRWEVRRAEEIANELKTITASNGKP